MSKISSTIPKIYIFWNYFYQAHITILRKSSCGVQTKFFIISNLRDSMLFLSLYTLNVRTAIFGAIVKNLNSQLSNIYLSHFISSFSTANINDNIGIWVFGKSLRDASLSTAESSWNGSGTSLDTREQGINDPLPCQKRMICMEFLTHRTRLTYWPYLQKKNIQNKLIPNSRFSSGILCFNLITHKKLWNAFHT